MSLLRLLFHWRQVPRMLICESSQPVTYATVSVFTLPLHMRGTRCRSYHTLSECTVAECDARLMNSTLLLSASQFSVLEWGRSNSWLFVTGAAGVLSSRSYNCLMGVIFRTTVIRTLYVQLEATLGRKTNSSFLSHKGEADFVVRASLPSPWRASDR